MNAEQLFEKALERVESLNCKEWATSEHNKPIWLKISQSYLTKNPNVEPSALTAYIVSTFIGL